MDYVYDPATRKMKHPKYNNATGRRAEEPPQERLWARCWLWMARGYSMPRTAEKVGVSINTLEAWSADERFKEGLAFAKKTWDQAAVRREIASAGGEEGSGEDLRGAVTG